MEGRSRWVFSATRKVMCAYGYGHKMNTAVSPINAAGMEFYSMSESFFRHRMSIGIRVAFAPWGNCLSR